MSIKSVKFRGRHNSRLAVLFLVTGIAALVLFVVLSVLSAIRGETPFSFGIAGVTAGIISVAGVAGSVIATRERDIYMKVPIAGMIINGISMILYVIVYVLGIV